MVAETFLGFPHSSGPAIAAITAPKPGHTPALFSCGPGVHMWWMIACPLGLVPYPRGSSHFAIPASKACTPFSMTVLGLNIMA